MSLMLQDSGARAMLKAYFNDSWPAGGIDLTLRLFVNDITPADDDVVGDYTEADGGGYAEKPLTNGSWTVSAVNDPPDAIYAEQTFTFTGALTTNPTIYGYYIVDDDEVLIYSERLDAAYTPTTNGDEVKVTPKYQHSKGTPTA